MYKNHGKSLGILTKYISCFTVYLVHIKPIVTYIVYNLRDPNARNQRKRKKKWNAVFVVAAANDIIKFAKVEFSMVKYQSTIT